MLRANCGGGSATAAAGKKRTSRTNRQPITESSPTPIGVRRYRPIRARISSMLATPFASPKNSQADSAIDQPTFRLAAEHAAEPGYEAAD